MTTCMVTLIVADHEAMREHYGPKLQTSALPPLANNETRDRHDVHEKPMHATRNCSNAYKKGKRSFEILAKLTPATLDAFQLCPNPADFEREPRSRRIVE